MKKKIIAFISLVPVMIWAQAFQHPNFDMYTPKNNHGELIELDLSELTTTLGISEDKITEKPAVTSDQIKSDYRPLYRDLNRMVPKSFFEQRINGLNQAIYRVLFQPVYGDDTTRNFSYEKIFVKETDKSMAHLRFEGFLTYQEYGWQSDLPEIYGDSMLIIRNGSFDGVMVYRIRYQMNYGGPEDIHGTERNSHNAYVYFFSDDHPCRQAYVEEADIEITASWPLLDNRDLFHYTIQNAFDQNPATSYVEDTEDDLMEVILIRNERFRSNEENEIIASSIINGYAKDEFLYFANNRIKTIEYYFYPDYSIGQGLVLNGEEKIYEGESTSIFIDAEVSGYYCHKVLYQLLDDSLKEQRITFVKDGDLCLFVNDFYKGLKYNDTCLAEIDFQYSNELWLFGGYNE